jgi:hypothetical protein
LTLTSLRTSNASRNVTSTYESGWIDGQSHGNESTVGISKVRTGQGSVKSSTTEVEMNDLETGHMKNRTNTGT